MSINSIINKCSQQKGFSLKNNPNSIELCMNLEDEKGRGSMTFFSVLPGITLAYAFINSPKWLMPDSSNEWASSNNAIIFNYCINGRCEILLNDTFAYLKDDEFSITKNSTRNRFTYPIRIYEGLEFYLDLDIIHEKGKYIKDVFNIDISNLTDIYCSSDKIYISKVNENIKNILLKLWNLYDDNSYDLIFKMQIYTLELFNVLRQKAYAPQPKLCTFFTITQVEIAQKTEQLITSDLKHHHPVKELAQIFSISETSLKNYFKGVYGQNISVYLREARMNTAAKMLESTKLSISKISEAVGYLNQSKFACVFKEKFNISPLEYRRKKVLEQFNSTY
ncbi:MAG TPA: AraC family transcriptional regulator [Clostridium sp.]|nr:AraC family transcriptional regulator [Clostridium sp.]